MERNGFFFQLPNGNRWQLVECNDGVVSAHIIKGPESVRWKRYATDSDAQRAVGRLADKLEKAQTLEEYNEIIERWHRR